jgi:Pentapeptide repeats (8 copies)
VKDGTSALSSQVHQLARRLRTRFAREDKRTTYYRVFAGEADFTYVELQKPTQVSFVQVDLSRVSLRGTNLRGTRLYDVRFWQESLRRNGLFDEVQARKYKDGPYLFSMLPQIEEAYRNVRTALEENRNYPDAADFYCGEMEARRLRKALPGRHLVSVEAWYRALSRYGTSIGVSATLLLLIIVLHTELALLLQSRAGEIISVPAIGDAALGSLRLALFQQPPARSVDGQAQAWIDLFFRVAIAVQLALFIFAFRAKIKRS